MKSKFVFEKRNYVIILFISVAAFFLLQESGKLFEEENKHEVLPERYSDENESKVVGTWDLSSLKIPYSGTLVINPKDTFVYHYGSCMTFGESKGNWEFAQDFIILNSVMPDTCVAYHTFPTVCVQKEPPYLSNSKTNFENCELSFENYFVQFDNEKFLFDNDTLWSSASHFCYNKRIPLVKN